MQSINDAKPKNEQLSMLQLLEIVAATSDILFRDDTTVFSAAEQGYGRINIWKALLTTANGSIASSRALPPVPSHSTFKELAVKDDSEAIKYYGFEIWTKAKGATVWIKDGLNAPVPVTTTPAVIMPLPTSAGRRNDQHVVSWSGITDSLLRSAIPYGSLTNMLNNQETRYVAQMTFSRGGLTQDKRLQVYRVGVDPTVNIQPGDLLIDVPLDIPTLKLQASSEDLSGRVTFDDFVFTLFD